MSINNTDGLEETGTYLESLTSRIRDSANSFGIILAGKDQNTTEAGINELVNNILAGNISSHIFEANSATAIKKENLEKNFNVFEYLQQNSGENNWLLSCDAVDKDLKLSINMIVQQYNTDM